MYLFYVADLVTITLEKKQYYVTEGEGEVEVCATLNSTYDVECAVPSDFQIYIASNGTAGDSNNAQKITMNIKKEA